MRQVATPDRGDSPTEAVALGTATNRSHDLQTTVRWGKASRGRGMRSPRHVPLPMFFLLLLFLCLQLFPLWPAALASLSGQGKAGGRLLLLASGSLQSLPWHDWAAGRTLVRTLAVACLPTSYAR